MADEELALDLTKDFKQEKSVDSSLGEGEPESEQTQDNTNGVKTDAEEARKEKPEAKDKSSAGGRKSTRYHPYKERRGGPGDKKAVQQRNHRVFISNIPYDMKWQEIKDLMREKGTQHVTYNLHL